MTAKRDDKFYMHLALGPGAATLCVAGDAVGVAFCSDRDQFSRATGRAIASGRAAVRGHRWRFELPPSADSFDRAVPLGLRVLREFELWLGERPSKEVPRWLLRAYLAHEGEMAAFFQPWPGARSGECRHGKVRP